MLAFNFLIFFGLLVVSLLLLCILIEDGDGMGEMGIQGER